MTKKNQDTIMNIFFENKKDNYLNKDIYFLQYNVFKIYIFIENYLI